MSTTTAQHDDRPIAIVADRLIDGTGADAVERAVVVCAGGRITAAGARADVGIPADAVVIEDDDLTLLPGFGDMHVHLAMQSGMNFGRMLMTPPSLALLHAVPNCRATLEAGVTSARDAGLTPAGVRMAVDRGLFEGPRMEVAVAIIGQTGGHADTYMPCGCAPTIMGDGWLDVPHGVGDGVDGIRHVVRETLRAGADWIKLCTSGGVLSPSDDPEHAQMTVEEIATAVSEARAAGRRVMSHAMSAAGIRNALVAGVTSIEHGCFLDEETCALMIDRGAWMVPTLLAPISVIERAEQDNLPPVMLEKARRTLDRHREAFRIAVEQGANIAMGTDSAVSEHGDNLRELPLMVACGMTPMQAIETSTRRCAELLGVDGALGTLEAGKLADVVAVRGDPLGDIALFDDRASVRVVVKAGRVVRAPGRAAVASAV